jgi:plastocyanin
MPAVYQGSNNANEQGYIKRYLDSDKNGDFTTKRFSFDLKPNVKPPTSGDNLIYYVNTSEGFGVKSVKLVITTNPGGANEIKYPPLTIESGPLPVYGTQWQITSTGLSLTPDSLYLEKLIIENIYKGSVTNSNLRLQAIPLIAGGWSGNPTIGYAGIPVKYDWIIEFEYTNVKQGTGLFFSCVGTMQNQSSDKTFLGAPKDAFLFFGSGGGAQNSIQWRRTFSPVYSTGISTKPILKYSVTSPLSENAVQNTASGPFWRRVSGSIDELYLSSSILNQTYGKSFVQAKLSYNGAVSTDFPLTVEPSFIEFDPVVDYWTLQEGDEIRFENNENLTYRITFVDDKDKNANSEDVAEKIKVKVSPPFQYTGLNGQLIVNQPSNFDFFVVRRYKENKNFIILNQQMPYGVISTGKGEVAFSGEDGFVGIEPVNPSSSPGLLLPQYRVDKFNVNPDLVLKDLIEKKII